MTAVTPIRKEPMTQTPIERRTATITLLETRLDWQPTLTSQFARFGATPGELATEPVECKSCAGTGSIRTRKGNEQCVRCDGKGSYTIDAYTGQREPEQRSTGRPLTGPERTVWRQAISAQLASLNTQLHTPRSEADIIADARPYEWERERERHLEHGDYQALDRALEWLGDQSPTARRLVEWAYEFRIITIGNAAPSIRQAATVSVDYLNQKMPDPVRVPPWLTAKHPALERLRAKHAA